VGVGVGVGVCGGVCVGGVVCVGVCGCGWGGGGGGRYCAYTGLKRNKHAKEALDRGGIHAHNFTHSQPANLTCQACTNDDDRFTVALVAERLI